MSQKSYDNSPTLYLIPTPIGNMDDMTFRSDILGIEETVRLMENMIHGEEHGSTHPSMS